jgi:hypothetical protein
LARLRSNDSSGGGGAYANLLPPTTHDVGGYVKHLWIESIDMMSSPGELGIFNACTNIEDVALTAGSLRLLYNLTVFGRRKVLPPSLRGGPTSSSVLAVGVDDDDDTEADPDAPEREVHTVGAASRIRSVTLTKHTFRYDWHFLVNIHTVSHHTHASLLANITHLRMMTVEKNAYVPVDYLANLTHLALPYLELRPSHRGDVVRVPDAVLQAHRTIVVGTEDDSSLERMLTPSRLKVVVLTVDEARWLSEPWQYGAHVKDQSPRKLFLDLRRHAKERDQRIRVVLSPRMGRDVCSEWAGAARGNEDSVWEVAEKMGEKETYADILPETYPRLST